MSLFLLLALLTAAPDAATDTTCEPVDGFPDDKGVPAQPTLVRWARSRLGPDVAGIVGALDWEQLSWSGTEGRYLAPPRAPAAWNLRLAVPEPFQLTASLSLEPGACLTPRIYGSEPPTAKEGSLDLEGPWRVELRLSAGDKTESLLLTGIPRLAVAWRREGGRPQASLLAEQFSWPFEFDLPIAQGTSERTWNTLTRPRPAMAWQQLLLALLTRGDSPARQRAAAVKLLATERQDLDGSVESALRALLLTKRLLPKEAAALDLMARARSEESKAPTRVTVDGDAPPRLWVDGQEVSGWAPRTGGFEVGTPLRGFVLVRAEWPGGETLSFWATLAPGVRLHLETGQGPRQDSPPEGERCIAVEGTDARWFCEVTSVPRQGPLDCPSPAYLQSAIALQSKRKNGADAYLYFVPTLPGRYTFRWHGPHLDGRWAPGCVSP